MLKLKVRVIGNKRLNYKILAVATYVCKTGIADNDIKESYQLPIISVM